MEVEGLVLTAQRPRTGPVKAGLVRFTSRKPTLSIPEDEKLYRSARLAGRAMTPPALEDGTLSDATLSDPGIAHHVATGVLAAEAIRPAGDAASLQVLADGTVDTPARSRGADSHRPARLA